MDIGGIFIDGTPFPRSYQISPDPSAFSGEYLGYDLGDLSTFSRGIPIHKVDIMRYNLINQIWMSYQAPPRSDHTMVSSSRDEITNLRPYNEWD